MAHETSSRRFTDIAEEAAGSKSKADGKPAPELGPPSPPETPQKGGPPPLPLLVSAQPTLPKPPEDGSPAKVLPPAPPAASAVPTEGAKASKPEGPAALSAGILPLPGTNKVQDPKGPESPVATPAVDGGEQKAGEAPRRTAKRRPAGPSRPAAAANDDVSSIGGLIFALHQQPSRRPLQLAAIASAGWALLSILLAWAMLAPELQRAPTFLEVLARPTAIVLAATILIPIALFWFLAILVRRAQELRLMSSAMTEVAIRLAEPDRMAEQQIASVGQAVRRQVTFMDDAIARALGRAGELEALVHNEVSNLERSYAQNEQRIRLLLGELSGERHALLNTSERVNEALRELGTEIPSLVEKLGEQQVKLARFIEDAGQNLVSLESKLATSATSLAQSVGSRTAELQSVFETHTQGLDHVLTARTQALQDAIATSAQHLDGTLVGHTEALQIAFTDRTRDLQSTLVSTAEALDGQLSGHIQRVEGALTSHADDVQSVLGQRVEEMQGVFTAFSGGLDQALSARTEGLQTVLEEYTRALDAALSNRQQAMDGMLASRQETFDAQLVERTRALDDAFSERLKLFDDSIVRSTIAVDSMVADKARALTAALETHAREVAQILGQQAGELDEQLMHGVNAVRRASENVSKQSLKAIEGLAGQAEMLKNVSENLVGQISNVSSRFDQQNQTIMKAANALESANYRIDKTLQNRQTELTETLEQLSRRTSEIDQVIRGYSTSIDGTFNEAEARARSVGDQIHRTAEERARQIESELARLQSTAATETDRALSDLRSKYSNVTREVAEEIGSLNSRFNETSEDMRQRAQRTLAEIETEQARLRDQLARLPEATRASTETLRHSLQEQIKALEQLSTLTTREAVRADVSPPLALPPAQASQPAPARSISSITQSLATEMASRSRGADGRRPAAAQAPAPASGAPAPRPQPSAGASASAAALLSPLQAPVQGLPSAPVRATAAPASPPLAPQARPADPGAAAGADAGRDGWKLGDLLARASKDEESPQAGPIDIQAIARSLDATTASAIWSRFRAGQRGIMVRSIYTNEGRTAFDEVQRRYKVDRAFQQTVDRFMADFENVLREADQRDPSGRTGQSYIVLESGRVYLFLAHASGRLA